LIINKGTAEKFTKYMLKYPELYNNLAQLIKENLSKSSAKSIVVDLGAGPCILSAEINKLIPEIFVINLDPSLKMLEMAEKHTFKSNHTKKSNILSKSENIPLKSDSIDIIVSRFSLAYWKNPKISFKEIYRVIKPNGRIILEILNKEFSKKRLFLIKLHMYIKLAGKEVIKYHIEAYNKAYTINQIETILKESKFSIIDKIGNKKDWKFIIIAQKNIQKI
jgi:ubiquinone/menaquinone biosynthesis C-methylase UbiE